MSEENPLHLEGDDEWEAPEKPELADTDVHAAPYEPAAQVPLEWTPERASSVVRAIGFGLHTADGLAREPEGKELWRATEADCQAIAPPLARILNRYEPARRLAGVADEGELAFAMIAYARKNLAERGKVAAAKHARQELPEEPRAEPFGAGGIESEFGG